jgi:CRP-like cAMP-binding protein
MDQMSDTTKLRQSIEALVKLSEESWQKIVASFKIKDLSKGTILLREGQVCQFVAYNVNGIFREYFYREAMDKTSDFIFQDTFFSAYSSFIKQRPSNVYIEALTDSRVFIMDFKTKQKLFETVPEWDRLARRITEEHYSAKERRANMLTGLTAIEKYRDLLKNGNPEIIRNIPMQHIASYLGIRPETLSRIRKKI